MSLAQLLPFLQALQPQVVPPSDAGAPAVPASPDVSNLPSFLRGDAWKANPPSPSVPTPDVSELRSQVALQQPMNQNVPAPTVAPPGETKGHKVLRLLQLGLVGGLN